MRPRKEFTRGAISVVAGLVLWEICARTLLENELLIPPPSGIARALWSLAVSGQLNRHVTATATELGSGFLVACVAGVVLGYLMGMYRWFDEIMHPWVAALSSSPVIVLVPLIIVWFGVGMLAKIIVVFKITLVPVMVNTSVGMKHVDRAWLELARSLRMSRWQTTWKIRLPAALPYVMTGMRLAVGRALVAVVVAELMASDAGLGYLLRESSETWESRKMFGAIVLLVVIGLTTFALIRRAEQRIAPWRRGAEWSTEA